MANSKDILLDRETVIQDFLEWGAKRGANKTFRKPVDFLATNVEGGFAPVPTKTLLSWSKQIELNKTLWHSEFSKRLKGSGAYIYDVVTVDGQKTVDVTWTEDVINQTKLAGKQIEIEFIIDKLQDSKNETYIISELRNTEGNYYTIRNASGELIDLDTLDETARKTFDALELEELEHNMGICWGNFSENLPIKKDSQDVSDRRNIEEELEQYYQLVQKMYEETFINTTKVVGTDASLDLDDGEDGSSEKARKTFLQYASRSVILVESFSNEGTADSTVVPATPAFALYRDEINNVMNLMLKKMGLATDVDSKGTVQQSKSEIVMAQGNEYESSEFRLNLRQQDLNRMVQTVTKIFTGYIKRTNEFKDYKNIQTIISQQETLSETEKLANLKAKKELGLMSEETFKIYSLAELNQTSIYEAWEASNFEFGSFGDK